MKKIEEMLDKELIEKELESVENDPLQYVEPAEYEKRIRLLKKIQALAVWFDDNADSLVKDGNNTYQKFTYVKGAQYRTMLRKGCIEVGLIFKQSDSNVAPQETTDGKNTVMVMHCMQFLIDPETGAMEQYVTATVGQDGTDKHLEKAKTQGIKSFVKSNFLISDGDADDNESNEAYETATAKPEDKKKKVETASDEQMKELAELILQAREKLNEPDYGKITMESIESGTLTLREYNVAKHKAGKA